MMRRIRAGGGPCGDCSRPKSRKARGATAIPRLSFALTCWGFGSNYTGVNVFGMLFRIEELRDRAYKVIRSIVGWAKAIAHFVPPMEPGGGGPSVLMNKTSPIRTLGGRRWRLAILIAALSALGAIAQQAWRVDDAALRNADHDADDWLTNGRDYAATRDSPLQQIDRTNVSQLGLAWYYDTDAAPGNLEATPIIADGTLYATATWSVVFALDARTGKQEWRYDPGISHRNFPLGPRGVPDSSKPRIGPSLCCGPANRGVAIYDGKVYAGLLDGRLVALDARTGKVVWQAQTTPRNGDYSITGAPRIVKGNVIIGNGGAEFATRGYVSAYNAETGKLVWRFYTVPGDPSKPFENKAMEVAAKTWTGEWYKMGGGGTVWDSMAYDSDLDLLYVGTGNGGPYPQKWRSPGGGDNLYVCSIIALRPETGKFVWYFQTTPGDEWDYDAVQDLTLADLKIRGKPRKVIMQASKNGFFYVLDRKTGKFLSAEPIAHITWAAGIDEKTGRPILAADTRYDTHPSWVSPGGGGIHSWHAMSFNPNTDLVYVPGGTSTEYFAVDPDFKFKLGVFNWAMIRNPPVYGIRPTGRQPGPPPPRPTAAAANKGDAEPAAPAFGGFLVAWDPTTQKQRWRIPEMNGGGTVTTAGDLVFAATSDGHFVALDATNGEKLWEAKLIPGLGNPATYMLDGKQYVSVLAGRTGKGGLYTFALGAHEPMPTMSGLQAQGGRTTEDSVYTSAQATQGKTLYSESCAACHMNDLSGNGEIPSLAGDSFTLAWNGHSLDELFELIRTTMPQNKPNSLSPQTYADIAAYILRVNNAPPGERELTSDPTRLKAVTIDLKGSTTTH